MCSSDLNARLRSLELMLLDPSQDLHDDTSYSFKVAWGEVRGQTAWFETCLRFLQDGPRTIGALEEHLGQAGQPTSLIELLQNTSLLLHKGLMALHPPQRDPGPAQRFNHLLAARVAGGGPYRGVACPASGNLLPLTDTQFMLLHAVLRGCQGETLAEIGRAHV